MEAMIPGGKAVNTMQALLRENYYTIQLEKLGIVYKSQVRSSDDLQEHDSIFNRMVRLH